MKTDIGIEKRKAVLTVSLLIESFTSVFLSRLLGIQDHNQTSSFSNRSGNLSFNQKVNLLIDIGALKSENRKKFLTFMEIRNQFMHNLEADTYEKCFGFLEGKSNYILKAYPQDAESSREQQLENATQKLANDVFAISVGLSEKVKDKIRAEVRLETLEHTQPALIKALAEFRNVSKT